MAKSNSLGSQPRAAGLTGGTGFSGIVVLIPPGPVHSFFLFITPAVTLLSIWAWREISVMIDSFVADQKINKQKRIAEKLYKDLQSDPSSDHELVQTAKKNRDAIRRIELEIQQHRAAAIVVA